jgi:hypothetical protein
VGAVLTRGKWGQKVRDGKEGWESARRGARAAGIYTSGCAGGRRQSGEGGCAEGALPETARPNPNERTPCLNSSRQTRARREHRKARPACRLLREATEKGVVNVARYYHHETVHVGGSEDDVNGNVRKGLDIMKASNWFRIASASKAEGKMLPPRTSGTPIGSLQRSTSRSTARKRSSSSLNAPLPSSKRTYSSSPHKQGESQTKLNRVRRRIILRDYGKGIHKASSRIAILAALEGNITDKKP